MNLSLENANKYFAKVMAQASDDEQAEFFNEFGRLLWAVCGSNDVQTQLAFMSSKLNANGRRLITELEGFVRLEK